MSIFSIDRVGYNPDPRVPLTFKMWQPEKVIMGKPMRDWCRFAVAGWHVLCNGLADPFGGGTRKAPLGGRPLNMVEAKARIDLLIHFMQIVGIQYYCWHDQDFLPAYRSLEEYDAFLEEIVQYLEAKQKETGLKCLWTTQALFADDMYADGAATSPSVDVFCWAAHQTMSMIRVGHRLHAIGHVLWGGREGWTTLWNTDLGLELGNLAQFLKMVVAFAKKEAPGLQIMIEPKRREPTIEQYDADVARVIGFLGLHGLLGDIKLNLETNHAMLAGYTMFHECYLARVNGVFASVDANDGLAAVGWDVDKYPSLGPVLTTEIMWNVLKQGGLIGGLNFDAKVRRQSFDHDALIDGHIGGMDNFAWGLQAAALLIEQGELDRMLQARYAPWQSDLGRQIQCGMLTLEQAAARARALPSAPTILPGHEERLEQMINATVAAAARLLAA